MKALITLSEIRPQEIKNELNIEGCGSLLEFSGIVRPYGPLGNIIGLFYDYHETMALKVLNSLVEDAKNKFGLKDIVAVHRVGKILVGEISLYVAISSEHREESLKAMTWILDEIKTKIPIWKKDLYHDKEEWHD